MTQINSKGQFVRTRKVWDGNDWNDGYKDNKGRVRVYRPDYPRVYSEGYALRAHVVYWLAKGRVHPKGTVLHHLNEIKDDDRFENLEVIEHGKHTFLHHSIGTIDLVCEHCKNTFSIKRAKYNQRIHEGTPIRFCSQRCFQLHPRNKNRIEIECLECKNKFEVIPFKKFRKFCSRKCSAIYKWRNR